MVFFPNFKLKEVASGSFEFLHQKTNATIVPLDVKEFARNMFETSTNENENLMRYIELLPKNEQLEIEDRPDLYQEFE